MGGPSARLRRKRTPPNRPAPTTHPPPESQRLPRLGQNIAAKPKWQPADVFVWLQVLDAPGSELRQAAIWGGYTVGVYSDLLAPEPLCDTFKDEQVQAGQVKNKDTENPSP